MSKTIELNTHPPDLSKYGHGVRNTFGGTITTVALSLDRLTTINNA